MNDEQIIAGVKYTPSFSNTLNLHEVAKTIEESPNFNLIDVLNDVYIVAKPKSHLLEVKIRIDGNLAIYSYVKSNIRFSEYIDEYRSLIKVSNQIIVSLRTEDILKFDFHQKIQLICHKFGKHLNDKEELINLISTSFNISSIEEIYYGKNSVVVPILPSGAKLHYYKELQA